MFNFCADIKRWACMLFVCALMLSCSKEVDIDIPEHKALPVVNSLLKRGEPIKIRLTQSSGIFDDGIYPLTNIPVKLYKDDEWIATLLSDKEGFCISLDTLQAKHTYGIAFEYGLHKISSRDHVPMQVPLMLCCYQDSVKIENETGHFLSECKIRFRDEPNQKNYYEIRPLLYYKNQQTNRYIVETTDISSDDPVLVNEDILWGQYMPYVPFSDQLFDGKIQEITFNYTPPIYSSGEFINEDYKLIIQFRVVSESYYKYKKSLIKHIDLQGGEDPSVWEVGLLNPLPMYSNVEGGYGIFGAYAEVTDTVSKRK